MGASAKMLPFFINSLYLCIVKSLYTKKIMNDSLSIIVDLYMKHLNQATEKVYDVKVLSSVYSEDEELIHHA